MPDKTNAPTHDELRVQAAAYAQVIDDPMRASYAAAEAEGRKALDLMLRIGRQVLARRVEL
jgi:hypothetical protein